MFIRLLSGLLLHSLAGAGLLAGGLALDALVGFRPLPPVPGIAALAVLLGATVLFRATRELAAAGPGRLVESGPYHVVRHPQSVGFQLVLLGAALALASPGCLLVCGPTAFLLWAAHARFIEEPALQRRFPRQYRRYRRGTGFFIPSIYFWSLRLIYLFYRLRCGLELRGLARVPRSGPFFLIALHRSYLDPYFMAFHLPRQVHYIATSVLFRHWLSGLYFKSLGCIPLVRSRADLRPIMTAFQLLDSGGAVGMFPEGARSWYGETACEPAVFKLLEKRRVPIVTAELEGAFEHQPRFFSRLRRSCIRVRYRVHPPQDSLRLVRDLMRRERLWDARRRALGRPQPARTAEQLVYRCPHCGVPFRCRGYADGRLACAACGTSFTLLEGKGLRGPAGVRSLPELEKQNLGWMRGFEPVGLRIAGQLVCRRTSKLETHLQGLRRLRLQDRRGLHPGALVLHAGGLVVDNGLPSRIPYDAIESVLVESNNKLEFSYRTGGEQGYVFFLPPLRYTLFLQHFLRLKAFANPYARYRGSNRDEIRPA